jgi:regulator of protease activity HflC (stomatin/prohibitin superfamily)
MFDKLIDIIIGFLDGLKAWAVVNAYQEGVVLRFGRYHRTLNPGIHWVIPLAETVEEVVMVPTTITLPAQTITTKDGKVVVAKAMVKCRVADSRVYTVEVYDAKDALSDTTCGIIFDTVHGMDMAAINEMSLSSTVTVAAKKEARKWGMSVLAVTFTDFGEVTTVRLINEGSLLT